MSLDHDPHSDRRRASFRRRDAPGLYVGTAVGVTGAVVGAGVGATGAVVGAGVDAVTTSDAETLRAERRACERRVRQGSQEDCRRYRVDD